MRRRILFTCLLCSLLSAQQCALSPEDGTEDTSGAVPYVRLKTSMGDIVIELYQDQTPVTVDNFLQYVDAGFYDGTIFHRVIQDFVVQGGGLLPGLVSPDGLRDPIVNEASTDRPNVRGTITMALTADPITQTPNPDSATSQFFINLKDNPSLDKTDDSAGYAVFGRVVEGMDVVDAIAQVATSTASDPNGNPFQDVPSDDVVLTSATRESSPPTPDDTEPAQPVSKTRATLQTSKGDIVIELFTSLSQAAVSFNTYVENGYYNDTIFHHAEKSRIKGGQYTTTLSQVGVQGLSGDTEVSLTNIRGRVALYSPSGSTSGIPHFLINLDDNGTLSDYVVIGRVVAGMDVADEIGSVTTEALSSPNLPKLPKTPIAVNDPDFAETEYRPDQDSDGIPDEDDNCPTTANANQADADDDGTGDACEDQEGQFGLAAAVSYSAGTNPSAIAAADLDGDGKTDLAVANAGSNNVSVLLGKGDGTFEAATNAGVGSSPVALLARDFDGDSAVDLAVLNGGDNNVSILVNDGEGTFSLSDGGSPRNFSVGTGPTAIAAADFNKDGNNDLAVANHESSNVTVLLNDGTADFSRSQEFDPQPKPENENTPAPTTTGASGVAAGDLDSDGNPDLAVANRDSDNVSVLVNAQGTGGLEATLAFDVDSEPVFLLAEDFNGDGKIDLAVVPYATSTVSVWLNNGDATFGFPARPSVEAGPVNLAAADLDGDGDTDLAVVNQTAGTVSVLLNKGSGTFDAALSYAVGSEPTGVAIADLDGDGDLDLAVANRGSNNVSVLLNTMKTSDNQPEPEPDGFTTTASGLKYKDVTKGTGALVTLDSTVRVLYTGRLNDENGDVFDSTDEDGQPREFQLSGLIKGWQEGLSNYDMREGGRRLLIIPPDLGYGDTAQSSIPANSTLWFDLEVVEIVE